MTNRFQQCRNLVVYLGNSCNFNCTYCDRDYIKNTIGGQHFTGADVPAIVNFIRQVLAEHTPQLICFHGGEPLVYVGVIDKILEQLEQFVPPSVGYYIQTNGSLITTNREFFQRWGKRLEVSISYDFSFQEINRSKFAIHEALSLLNECGVRGIQMQYVIPSTNPAAFSLATVKSITDICFKHNVRRIVLIPLRHIRGGDKFEVLIDQINLPQFFDALVKFIHVLYALGMYAVVDGHGTHFDKDYFNNHKQLIMSPDGLLYPEYDFLEYKMTAAAVGQWKERVHVNRVEDEKLDDARLRLTCQQCPAKKDCGIKYLHHAFDVEPNQQQCQPFYQQLTSVINYTIQLYTKPSMVHWVFATTTESA